MSLLREVCSDRKTLDYLRGHGLSELRELLEYPVSELQRHPDRWACLERDLRKFAETDESYRGEIALYLSGAPSLAREVAEPYSRNLSPLQRCQRFLSRQGLPQPLRRLRARLRRDGVALPALEELRAGQDNGLILHTLGPHTWVALAEWGNRGARLVAESSWRSLPLLLESRIVSKRQDEISPDLWEVFAELAERDGHDQLAQLIQSVLAPAPVVPIQPKSKIFQGLEKTDSLDAVVQKIVAAAKELPRPFSLAELRLNSGDLEWLKSWFAEVKAARAELWLQSWQASRRDGVWRWSDSEAFGLVFLVLTSEIARRDALPGKLWSYVSQRIPDKLAAELFVQGQPSGLTRAAVEAACRRFQLRHTFGLEGVQMWYQTVFLQFGLSLKAIPGLGLWLEQPDLMPAGIARLYDQSEVFKRLWTSLRNHRERPTASSLEALNLILNDSPFVLPEWQERLVQWTTAEPQAPGQLLQAQTYWAKLEWGSEGPRFWIDAAAMTAELEDVGYQVVLNQQVVAQLELEPMGYACEPPRVYLEWQSEQQVEFISDSDSTSHTRVVRMLDPNELGQLYQLESGEYLRGEVECREACALLLPEGYTTLPVASAVQSLGKGRPSLHRFNKGLPQQCQILYRGQELTSIHAESQQDWLRKVQAKVVQLGPIALPAPVEMTILGIPADGELRWVRRGHTEVDFEKDTVGYRLKIRLESDLDGPSLRLLLGIQHKGKMHRISRSVPVSIYDMTWYSGQAWSSMRRITSLTVEDARQLRFRFFGAQEKPHTFALFEGDVFSRSLVDGRQELGRLGGYGDALYIHRGPFNHVESGTLIAREVVDRGKIDWVEPLGQDISVQFTQPMEADEDFEIVGWDGDGDVCKRSALDWPVWSGLRWSGAWAGPQECLAIAYRGDRRGGWWQDALKFPFALKNPALWFSMLRWLNFPVLSAKWEDPIKKLVKQHPKECLRSWLLERSVPDFGLVHPDVNEGWRAAVRKLFAGWQPGSQDQADTILDEIGPHQLLSVNSLLVSRCLEIAYPGAPQEWLRCAADLAGCDLVSELEKRERELAREAASDLGTEIDSHFIEKLCERMLTKPGAQDVNNFKLANRVYPFRLLFCVRNLRRKAEEARKGTR